MAFAIRWIPRSRAFQLCLFSILLLSACATVPYEAPRDGIWDEIGIFSEGLAPVRSGERWGYADLSGAVAILPQFAQALPFSGGKAAVKLSTKWGFIDRTGRYAIRPQYEAVGSFSEGLASVKTKNGWGFIDESGRLAIPGEYDEVGSFGEEFAAVRLSQRWGFIDRGGRVMIGFGFKAAGAFSAGKAPVAKLADDDEWGFIDKNGHFAIEPAFDGARGFADDKAAILVDGFWGFISDDGSIAINPRFDAVGDFSEGLAPAKEKGLWGLVDDEGEWHATPRWAEIDSFSSGWALIVDENDSMGLMDVLGSRAGLRADRNRGTVPVGAGDREERVTIRVEVRDFRTNLPVRGYAFTKALGEYGDWDIPDPPHSGADGVVSLGLERWRYDQTRELFGQRSGYWVVPLDVSDRKLTYAIKTLSTDAELPKIEELLCLREGHTEASNVLFQAEEYEMKKPGSTRFEFKVWDNKFAIKKYYLQQGNKRLEFGEKAFDLEVGMSFSMDDPIHAGIVIDYQGMSIALPTYLKVRKPKELKEPLNTVGAGPKTDLPEDAPFLKGVSGSYKIPGLNFKVEFEDEKISLYLGIEIAGAQKKFGEHWQDSFKSWMKGVGESREYFNQLMGFYNGMNPRPHPEGEALFSASIGAVGYVELTYGKNGLEVVGGYMAILGEFGWEFSTQFMAGIVPVYASLGIGGEITIKFKNDGKAAPMGDFFSHVTFQFQPYIDAEAGVGVKGLLSIGLALRAGLEIEITTIPFHSSGTVLLDFFLRVRILFVFSWEQKLAGKEWHLWGSHLEPGSDPGGLIVNPDAIKDQFVMESRDYLTAGSQWLGDSAPPQYAGDGPPVVAQPLKTNILPGSEPLITLFGGKEVLFWTDDSGTGRSGADRATLMFSFRRADGSWEAGTPVWDDRTGDYDFSVLEYKGELWAAWQNTTMEFKKDSATKEEILSNSEILAAVYDPKSGKFQKPRRVSGDEKGAYYGRPRIATDGDYLVISHVYNDKADYLLENGMTRIQYVRMKGGGWGPGVIWHYYPGERLISYDLVVEDGTIYVVTLEDQDGKLGTIDDRKIQLVSSRTTMEGVLIYTKKALTEGLGIYCNPLVTRWKGKNAVFYYQVDKGTGFGNYYYFEDLFSRGLIWSSRKQVFERAIAASEDFSLVTGPNESIGILFLDTINDKEKKLQSAPAFVIWDRDRNGWSLPVLAWDKPPEEGRRAEAPRGVWPRPERIEIAYRSIPATSSGGNNAWVPTNLNIAFITPAPDLAISPRSILRYYEPEVSGNLLPFKVEVVNQGLATAHGIMSDLLFDGGTFSSKGYGKAYKRIDLRPGEKIVLPMEYRVPSDAKPEQFLVSVRPLREIEYHTANNTTPMRFHDPDLSFGDVDMIRKGFERRFVVEVLNRSPVRVNNVELALYDAGGERVEIHREKLGTILPNKATHLDFTVDIRKLDWSTESRKLFKFELTSSDVLKGGIPGSSYVVFNPFSYPAFSLAVFDARTSGPGYVWVSAAATNNHPVKHSGELVVELLDQNDTVEDRAIFTVKVPEGGTEIVTKLFRAKNNPRSYKIRVSMPNSPRTVPGDAATGGLMDVGGEPIPVETPISLGNE